MRAALPLQRSNLSGTLFGSPEGAAFATWQECRQNCSRTPGCAAFQWSAGAQSCQHYTNEPNATNLLEPCAAAGGGGGGGCTFGYRLAGLCGRTASHSITCVLPSSLLPTPRCADLLAGREGPGAHGCMQRGFSVSHVTWAGRSSAAEWRTSEQELGEPPAFPLCSCAAWRGVAWRPWLAALAAGRA